MGGACLVEGLATAGAEYGPPHCEHDHLDIGCVLPQWSHVQTTCLATGGGGSLKPI